MGSGNQDAGAFGRILYFHHIYLNALGGIEGLPFDHLILIEHGVHLAQVHTDILANIPLYNTGHHIFFLLVVLIVQGFSLFLPDFLQNHVLGILGGNTAELLGTDVHPHHIPQIIFGIFHAGVCKTDLSQIVLHLIHHCLFRVDFKLAGVRINVDHHVADLIFAVMVLAGLQQRLANRLQQRILADVLLFFKNC